MSRLHLAGIIPVANLITDFGISTPEVLLPVAPSFSAIQKSVYECAMAGCNTIWIVANDDLAPVVREVVGDWAYDPVYYRRPSKFSSEQRKEVPIYYVPIHPKDRDRRDSYGWSVLYGIHSAWKVAYTLSRWIVPDKYYISFPLGTFDVEQVRQHRREISSADTNFFFTNGGNTVKNNNPISFTMTGEDFKLCRRSVNKKTTREYLPPSPGQLPTEKRPLNERWSARFFDLPTVFQKLSLTKALTHEIDWFYDITSWDQYRSYMASDNRVEVPYYDIYKPRMYNLAPTKENKK